MKKLIFALLIIHKRWLFQQDMSILIPNAVPIIVLSDNTKTLSFNSVPNGFSNTIALNIFTSPPIRISHNYEFYLVQYLPILNEQYVFTYTNMLGVSAQFTLAIVSNNANQLIVSTCGQQSPILSNLGSAIIGCNNANGESFQIGVSLQIQQLLYYNSIWTAINNTSNSALSYLYKFTVSFQYSPQTKAITNDTFSFNYINVNFLVKQTANQYLTFTNSNLTIPTCPVYCLNCDLYGVCLACNKNFIFNTTQNSCTCPLSMISYLQILKGNITIGTLSQYIYQQVNTCVSKTTIYQTCLNSVQNLNQPFYFNMYTNSTFNSANSLSIGINDTSTLNFNKIDPTCLDRFQITFSMSLDYNQDLSLLLAPPITFSLSNTQIIDLSNVQFCRKFNYTNFGFYAKVCPITTSFIFLDPTFNQTLFQRNNSFITIFDLRTNTITGSYFTNNFIAGGFFGLTTTNWSSALICLDIDCLTFPTSNNVTNGHVLFVVVALSDPVLLQNQPTVYPHLIFNNNIRNSLIVKQIPMGQNTIMFVISLDSVELFNSTNVNLILSYGLSSGIVYNNTEVVSFSVYITKNMLYFPLNPSFSESLRFHWLIVSISILVLSILFGLCSYCVSFSLRKEASKYDDDIYKNNDVTASRFRNIEMSSPTGKSNLAFLMGSQKKNDPPVEAKRILERLIL